MGKDDRTFNREEMSVRNRNDTLIISQGDGRDIDVDIVWQKFHCTEERTLYVEDAEGYLYGIITQGDLCRYIRGEKASLINVSFTKFVECEEEKAYSLMECNPKIMGIPIINDEGQMVKEICRKKPKARDKVNNKKNRMQEYYNSLDGVFANYDKILFLFEKGEENQCMCLKKNDNLVLDSKTELKEIIEISRKCRLLIIDFCEDLRHIHEVVAQKYKIPYLYNEVDLDKKKENMNKLHNLYDSVGIFDYERDFFSAMIRENKKDIHIIKQKLINWSDTYNCYELCEVTKKIECIFTFVCYFEMPWIVINGKYVPIIAIQYIEKLNAKEHEMSATKKTDMDIAANIIPMLEDNGVKCIVVDNVDEKQNIEDYKLLVDFTYRSPYAPEHKTEVLKMIAAGEEHGEKEEKIYEAFFTPWNETKGFPQMNNILGEYYNAINGCRYTNGNSVNCKNTFFLFGPCTVAGKYVEDTYSLGSLLRKKVPEEYYIKNMGSAFLVQNFDMRLQTFHSGDVVVIMSCNAMPYIMNGIHVYSVIDAWRRVPHLENHVLSDSFLHCNKIVTASLAEEIFNLCKRLAIFSFSGNNQEVIFGNNKNQVAIPDELQKWLVKVRGYRRDILKNVKVGAVVMNCNPFSLGHLYLIEEAKKSVDILYVFVVEENKSFFDFEDRINMVRLGVQGLENVVVIPSGRYIISSETLPGYFDKENNPTTEFDATEDLEIFAKIIAKEFNIKIRFAGSEPHDAFTKRYNEYMSKLLPEYGIEFREIERKTMPKKANVHSCEEVISASLIRRYMKENNYDKVRELVTPSVYNYLKKHYFNVEDTNQIP